MQFLKYLCITFFLLIPLELIGQESKGDSISFSEAINSFLGLNRPKLGFMSQFATELSDNGVETRTEFTMRNLRFYFTGKSGDKFSYFFQGNINGKYEFLDLRLTYNISKIFRVDFGRLKTPFGTEFLKNDARLLFITRSMNALLIGPLRQYGVQLNSSLFEKRVQLTAGIFNGSESRPQKISLVVGKINLVPILEKINGSQLELNIGGSSAYTKKKEDLPNYVYIDNYHLLYGTHARLSYGSYWLEGEYNAASSNNKKTIEGFACDLGRKFGKKWEAAVRFDWIERYSVLYYDIVNIPVQRKFLIGVNWYPLDNIKIQFDLEKNETTKDINTFYLNFQYAINYE